MKAESARSDMAEVPARAWRVGLGSSQVIVQWTLGQVTASRRGAAASTYSVPREADTPRGAAQAVLRQLDGKSASAPADAIEAMLRSWCLKVGARDGRVQD